MISPNRELRQIGKYTQIRWFKDFTSYKCLLTGSSKRADSVFQFFNENVFEGGTAIASFHQSDYNRKVEDAIQAFGVDDSEDDSGESAMSISDVENTADNSEHGQRVSRISNEADSANSSTAVMAKGFLNRSASSFSFDSNLDDKDGV